MLGASRTNNKEVIAKIGKVFLRAISGSEIHVRESPLGVKTPEELMTLSKFCHFNLEVS